MRNFIKFLAVTIALVAGLIITYIVKDELSQTVVPTVGHLYLSEVDRTTFDGFKDGMIDFGYKDGETVNYISGKSIVDIAKLRSAADLLVTEGVDLIFVSSTPATLAVRDATYNYKIPVVFCPVNDPVASGIVKDISQPGGNITGIRLAIGDQRRFQLLKEIDPNVAKVFFPYTSHDKSALKTLQQIEKVAGRIGVTIVRAPTEGKEAVAEMLRNIPEDINAIFIPRDSTMESYVASFVNISYKRKIAISAPSSLQADAGALFSYGHNHYQLGVQASRLASQILRGSEPGVLPIETAKYYLDINLKSAKLIELDISEDLLRQADRIIR
ncbi:MAG: ABC transporter substrate-binding protein [Desulfobulbaceae bacterium]|nr:ABC transporter substrate-binding protein [Desulfobulbaceae bacterium]